VDDELYHRARVRAAQQRTSLSALVRSFLEQLTEDVPAFDRLRREQNDLIARIRAEHPGFSAADRLTRAQVHERRAVP
jgi:plasmid stability protein